MRFQEEPFGPTVDGDAASEFDQFADIAATLCATPMAAVTLIKDHIQWIKGAHGISRMPIPAEESFCIHTVRGANPLEVPDTLLDGRFQQHPLVRKQQPIRFYAGVPLKGPDGSAVGALCVVDTSPRPDGLSREQRQALEMLAGQASLQLRLQQAIGERDAAAREARTAIADLQWAVSHDHMTGLGNRALLRKALSDIRQAGASVALLAIDVDHFKRINDSFGHQAGDELLRMIGQRLTAAVRAHDLVIRLGGDEFAVVLRDLPHAHLSSLASRLLDVMREPVEHDGRLLECRISIGGAQMPTDTNSLGDLMRFADAALREAKSRGRGRYLHFEPAMMAEQSRRLDEIACARRALAQGQIVPFYQPKVDIADGSIQGLEALLRLVVPGMAPASPQAIAAAFDEPELAQKIGETMLSQILRDMQGWIAAGLEFGRVAINVSAVEVNDPTFPTRLLAALDEHRIAPHLLEIEVVEGVLLDERSGAVLEAVQTLSEAGITIAFDDFGTGHAALAHLPRFPVDVMKIDRSFVTQLDLRANQAIVSAILSIGKDLGMDVVAEGVETTAQAAELLRLGCTKAQGFLYSKAISAESIGGVLPQRRSRATCARTHAILLADSRTLSARAA